MVCVLRSGILIKCLETKKRGHLIDVKKTLERTTSPDDR